jgi:hypothetical protein
VTQLDMFKADAGTPPKTVRKSGLVRPSISDRFEAFHAGNPHVLAEMLRLARARLERGDKRIGAKALWEELRQSIRVRKLGNWKLDNSLTALYARRLIEVEPALEDVIETRKRKAK